MPEWPLPAHSHGLPDDAADWLREREQATDARELELWEWAWRTPQACAWSLPSEQWRAQSVARWVRQAVLCERPSAKAADHGQLHRYADQIGLTTAGLREMGWKVAVDELAGRRAHTGKEQEAGPPAAPRARRLRAAGDQ
ncbi:hypothetical protein [Auraticoccus monumenti]|uniref:hypothetical protein n=1 Tax=Auraticoccus monumenti TaxID=675864 RepID=UPI0018D28514|nr:hypothetical protein [Auraticoccus monumenti]